MGFVSFKGRNINPGEKVRVYRNLHNGKWSIQCCKTGLILGHAETLTLVDTTFEVNERERQRVIKEKRKNVHAKVRGSILTIGQAIHTTDLHEVYYNPYTTPKFVDKHTGENIESLPQVHFQNKRVYILGEVS